LKIARQLEEHVNQKTKSVFGKLCLIGGLVVSVMLIAAVNSATHPQPEPVVNNQSIHEELESRARLMQFLNPNAFKQR
jgi:hypothetical protein